MPISRTTIAGSIAGAILLLSAGAAFATPGQATAAVNVRSGPGTQYGIVAALSPGESVDVQQCQGSWCYIDHSGPDGWVSANFLTTGANDSPPPPVYYDDQPPPDYYDEPEYLPPPVYYGGPVFGQHPPYFHRRQPFQPGFPPPNGQKPPFHFHNPPPGGHVGNPGQFGQRPHVDRQNFCAADPSKCQGFGHH